MTIHIIRTFLVLSGCLLSTIIFAQDKLVKEQILTPVAVNFELDNKELPTAKVLKLVKENQPSQPEKTSLVQTPSELNNPPILTIDKTDTNSVTIENSPQVGKHVMANMNASSMILSLLMVLALIVICALILKRFNLVQQGVSQLTIVSSLSLGSKERVVVVQAGQQQFMLGVTSQQVNLLEKLSEPLSTKLQRSADLPKSVLSFFSSKNQKNQKNLNSQ
jgi:flagellar protein FliO/FliZ